MQLHPSAPFGAPNSSLTLTPALESGPPPANNTHFAGVFEQSLCPPPPSPLAPVAEFSACATRPYLRDEPACASNLPASRTYLRVEPTCASWESTCQSLCPPPPSPLAPVLQLPACATRPLPPSLQFFCLCDPTLPARRAYLRVEPTCASSLPARRGSLPANSCAPRLHHRLPPSLQFFCLCDPTLPARRACLRVESQAFAMLVTNAGGENDTPSLRRFIIG